MTYRAIIEPAVLEDRLAWRWKVQRNETPAWQPHYPPRQAHHEDDTWRTLHAGILRREADAREEAEAMLKHVAKGTQVIAQATVA